MAAGARLLRPVRIPIPPHPHTEPRPSAAPLRRGSTTSIRSTGRFRRTRGLRPHVLKIGAAQSAPKAQAAGRGGCRSGRAASSRTLRRVSRTTTLAGRGDRFGGAATRTRCRCITRLLSLVGGGCGLCPRPLTYVVASARSRHARANPERTSRGDGAGGIRTHDLELMRLARTAAPLPRGGRPRRRSRHGPLIGSRV